jgi:hypothetical protein
MNNDFKDKYLKYKNKYLNLKNKIGGYLPHDDTYEEFNKYVKSGLLKEYDIEFDDFEKISSLFKYLENNRNLIFTPENFDEFIGKIEYTEDDKKKFWSRLNNRPVNNSIVELNNNVYYKNRIIEKRIKIKKNENINKTFKKIFLTMIRTKFDNSSNLDEYQFSGILEAEYPIYFDKKNIDIVVKNINNYKSKQNKDISGKFTINDKNIYDYKYYIEKNILFVYTIQNSELKLYMFNVIDKDYYEVFPYSYNNLLLNEKYEFSVKKLFETILKKLKDINEDEKYGLLPDGFFHIHLTRPYDQKKYIMLTLHTLYEITSSTNKINYKYKDNEEIYDIQREYYEYLQSNKNQSRKKHTFYILFNLDLNKHFLYELDKQIELNTFFDNSTNIGFSETFLGNNFVSLNHIKNKGVFLGLENKACSIKCKPECTPENCKKIIYDDKEYYFIKDKNNSKNYILVCDKMNECASVLVSDKIIATNENIQNIFIEDIRVNKKFENCTLSLKIIQELIKKFALSFNPTINTICLDDASFLQFPETYISNMDAKYIWPYIYLKNRISVSDGTAITQFKEADYHLQPIKFSIYSCKLDYNLRTNNPYAIEFQQYLDFIVGYYNNFISNYNLLENAEKINKLLKTTPIIQEDIYIKFDGEYDKFKKYVDSHIILLLQLKFNKDKYYENEIMIVENIEELPAIYNKNLKLTDYYNSDGAKNDNFNLHLINDENEIIKSINISNGYDNYFKNVGFDDMLPIIDSNEIPVNFYNTISQMNMITYTMTF